MARKRCKLTDNFKAQVALEALRGDRTIQEIAAKHNVLPTQVSTWSEALNATGSREMPNEMSPGKRKTMVERNHAKLRLSAQCRILNISRSTFYYQPKPVDAETLALMKQVDQLFTKYPFFGSRQVTASLKRDGHQVGRQRVRRLMRLMGLEAVYKRPKTSQPHPAHPIYPYLLKGIEITRPNQVWCSDITFIPISKGYLYLVAIMDWATRKVLSWRFSNTMHADFCVVVLREAIAAYGPPEIMNTDQGSQFTGSVWIKTLTEAEVRIGMDGRGRCMDNIMIERLWRSLKYGAVYLQDIADGFAANRVIDQWIRFYNAERPHSTLGNRTPDGAYGTQTEIKLAA
ncbi:MAG: IS3 family transposase [Pseudomonadota bacterium]